MFMVLRPFYANCRRFNLLLHLDDISLKRRNFCKVFLTFSDISTVRTITLLNGQIDYIWGICQ
jgi:hypothetical protein